MLSAADYESAAKRLDLEDDVAAVKAVAHVESRGKGFNDDGSLVILFEAHIFHRLTGGRHDASNPNISSPTWRRELYAKSQFGEHQRLAAAMNIDPELALRSISMGAFQIMGFNFRRAGFSDARSMYETMRRSEASQLHAFCEFIKGDGGLMKALKEHDWATFARYYNGPAYAENKYDTKLERAYQAFA